MSRMSKIITRFRGKFKRRSSQPTTPQENSTTLQEKPSTPQERPDTPQEKPSTNSQPPPNIPQVTQEPLRIPNRKFATCSPRMLCRSFTIMSSPQTTAQRTSDRIQDAKPLIPSDTQPAPPIPSSPSHNHSTSPLIPSSTPIPLTPPISAPPKFHLRRPVTPVPERLPVRMRKEAELGNESAKRLPRKRGGGRGKVEGLFGDVASVKDVRGSWGRGRWNTVR